MKIKTAVEKINKNGILLVFPKNNNKEPRSLWSEFYPRTPLRWEWDSGGDRKVFDMWMLMKRLSDCREVVYSKWYQGRATFISREVFTAMLAQAQKTQGLHQSLSPVARTILSELEMDSPLSTKNLKKLTELQGKDNAPAYDKGMKELFSKFLIVAYGEVDDGAFPSLAVGSTRTLYEDLWNEAEELSLSKAQNIVDKWMPKASHFRKFLDKVLEG